MPKLPRISSNLVLKILKKNNFYIHHQTGSHVQLKSLIDLKTRVTIPANKKELSPKTLKSIIKQSGLTLRQFLDLI